MNLEQLTFESANDLIVDLYQNKKEIYYKVEKAILTIRDYNLMLGLVKDSQIKEKIENKRKELIEYVLWNTRPHD